MLLLLAEVALLAVVAVLVVVVVVVVVVGVVELVLVVGVVEVIIPRRRPNQPAAINSALWYVALSDCTAASTASLASAKACILGDADALWFSHSSCNRAEC